MTKLRALFGAMMALTFILTVYIVALFIPAESMWYDPMEIVISDGKPGDPPRVSSSRVIKTDFLGSYSVIVRSTDGLRPYCDGRGGPFMYRAAASAKPVNQALDEWAGGSCVGRTPPPGRYQVDACWTVEHPFGILPPKTTCRLRGFTVEG
jgi:hypothetical protein